MSTEFSAEFVQFLNESCTAFHAVEASKSRLLSAGFVELSEKDAWNLAPNGKYFFIRSGTTLIAFTVGGAYQPGNGYTILGAHTDSPCLKVKPVTTTKKSDALVVNTANYGGGLWHTWFDRDLGLAGRVIITNDAGGFDSRLVRIDRPIARIPNLAIHLTSGSEREHFSPNLHEHGKAILSMDPEILSLPQVNELGESTSEVKRLNPFLLSLVSEELGSSSSSSSVPISRISDLELQLIDVQPSCLGGARNEFIYSGRLDNLCSSYQCLRALIDGSNEENIPLVDASESSPTAVTSPSLSTQPNIRVCMLFDHEEVGSESCSGAGSSLLMDTLHLIHASLTSTAADSSSPNGTSLFLRSLRKSFVVSADMAHGLHPNYPGKHDATMAPQMNRGLVVKHNANQRYATSSLSASLFRRCGSLAQVPLQEFTVRADSACGSTIGSIIATLSGILTVDVGTPQFAMHSIREMMGSSDAYNGYKHILSVLIHHPQLAEATTAL